MFYITQFNCNENEKCLKGLVPWSFSGNFICHSELWHVILQPFFDPLSFLFLFFFIKIGYQSGILFFLNLLSKIIFSCQKVFRLVNVAITIPCVKAIVSILCKILFTFCQKCAWQNKLCKMKVSKHMIKADRSFFPRK